MDNTENGDQLISEQYKGKESLKSIYDKIIKYVSKFGSDIEISPKKASVSLRIKNFALVSPLLKQAYIRNDNFRK